MKIYLKNQTQSDILVNGLPKLCTLRPNEGSVFEVSPPGKITVANGVVLAPNADDTLSTSDDDRQLSEIEDSVLREDGVADEADFAFAVVPPGDGDGDDESSLIDLVIEDLTDHGFKVAEIEEGIFLAQDGNAISVMLREQSEGILFQSGIKTRKLSEGDFGTLFVYMNSFNNGSLLTKAFMPNSEFTAVSFEAWLPPAYSAEMFAHFFSIYLSEIKVNFDEELREQMDEFLLR